MNFFKFGLLFNDATTNLGDANEGKDKMKESDNEDDFSGFLLP